MKKLGFKKKNLIALALVAAVVVSGFSVFRANAAERVDLTKDISITANIDSSDTSLFATSYSGTIYVDLYKIATVDESGNPTLTSTFSKSGADLSVLSDSPSVETIQEKIVDKVTAYVNDETNNVESTATITAIKGEDGISDNSVTLSKSDVSTSDLYDTAAGIYLYVPRDAVDACYTYSFTSYIIYAPSSTYIATGTGSDEWNYAVSFNLKSSESHRYGDLQITKILDTYNESLGTASFVFDVEAEFNGETVFSNVYSLNFDSAGTDSILIEGIMAGATVTVTEVYSGASYSVTSDEAISTTIDADDTVTVEFTNDYNDKLVVGGVGIENHFVRDDSAESGYSFSGSNLTSEEQESEEQ